MAKYRSVSSWHYQYSDRDRLNFNDVSTLCESALRRVRRCLPQWQNLGASPISELDRCAEFHVFIGDRLFSRLTRIYGGFDADRA